MLIKNNSKIARDLTVYLVYAFRWLKRNTFLKNVFGANQSASRDMTEESLNIAKMLYDHAQVVFHRFWSHRFERRSLRENFINF